MNTSHGVARYEGALMGEGGQKMLESVFVLLMAYAFGVGGHYCLLDGHTFLDVMSL